MQNHRERRQQSSFSHHRWSQLSPPHPSPITATAGPSNSRHQPALDESTRAYRTMALRQMNSYQPKPWSRTRRQTVSTTRNNPPGTPQSQRPVSQPVLVRTYSGNTGENINNNNNNKPADTGNHPTTTSPGRLSIPFLSNPNPSSTPQNKTTGPTLPPPDSFSIESILTSINPTIQPTLTTIAEIYGRSKLSLANEYESHIAPLGEIRVPPGYLLPVDEASSEQERQHDGTGTGDVGGGDSCYMSFAPFSVAGDGSSVLAEPDTPRSIAGMNLGFELDGGVRGLGSGPGPVTREFAEGDGVCGRGLLGEDVEHRVVTPAVVSEVLLDAQANQVLESGAGDDGAGSSLFVMGGLQSFFSRIARYGQAQTCRQSAEVQLRAMLHRDLSAD